jgi:RHS repeat-associated protein
LPGLEYKNNVLELIHFPNGRIDKTGTVDTFQYYLTDHLGNIVVLFQDTDGDGVIALEEETNGAMDEVIQRNYYYSFGLRVDSPDFQIGDEPKNRYLYNGKELNEELGLNWLDYGFRWYDPAVGRFPSVDPAADQFAWVSPFNYAENEPIGHIDLWGLQGESYQVLFNDISSSHVSTNLPYRHQNIAIDPGHGDRHRTNSQVDPGAISGDHQEKNYALEISNAINDRFIEVGLSAQMTRTGDIDVRPQSRLEWRINAAEDATVFISIHLNAAQNENARGFEVHYRGNDSQGLAESIANEQSILPLRGDGIHESNFFVLRNFENGPSVLVEAGFITNEQDRNIIQENSAGIGRQVADGVINYLENQNIISTPENRENN